MRRPLAVPLALLLTAALFAAPTEAQELEAAFPSLSFDAPVDIQAPDDGSNRLFVVEQAGVIRVVENDRSADAAPVFLDITGRVSSGGERGLLGLAFAPDYAQSGLFYVYYTRDNPDGSDPYESVVAEFSVTADPDVADAGSEEILLTVDQPFGNHNAGQLQFGPPEGASGERYLYVALGDGGSGGDPLENGEDPTTLLGSLLRIDVGGGGLPLDCAAGTGTATVPADNPLADGAGNTCDEIWAYGLRNPYRFSFAPDGTAWIADVGQGRREEIDLGAPGANYGWDVLEGSLCFEPMTGCDPSGTVLPIYEYSHDFTPNGGFSIIGGYVYDGPSCADLRGDYVYGDFVTQNIWALEYDGQTATNRVLFPFSGVAVSTFGTDEQGELFVANLGAGELLRFDCESPVEVSVGAAAAPLTVPASGGTITLSVTLTNTTAQAQATDGWISADLSNGAEVAVVFGPRAVTVPANGSVSADVRLRVPGGAPSGASTVVVKVGDFPDEPTDAATITFTKTPAAVAAQGGAPLTASGFDFAVAPDTAPAAVGAEGTAVSTGLVGVAPNPFGTRATVRFALAEAGPVRLAVYDVLGREVAVLTDGPAEAGAHSATFDAAGLPSGAYLVRLEVVDPVSGAGGTVATQRITLVR